MERPRSYRRSGRGSAGKRGSDDSAMEEPGGEFSLNETDQGFEVEPGGDDDQFVLFHDKHARAQVLELAEGTGNEDTNALVLFLNGHEGFPVAFGHGGVDVNHGFGEGQGGGGGGAVVDADVGGAKGGDAGEGFGGEVEVMVDELESVPGEEGREATDAELEFRFPFSGGGGENGVAEGAGFAAHAEGEEEGEDEQGGKGDQDTEGDEEPVPGEPAPADGLGAKGGGGVRWARGSGNDGMGGGDGLHGGRE